MSSILIIRFSSLGDVTLLTGVIKAIRDQKPDIRIDLLTFSTYASLFKDYQYLRDIYCVDRSSSISQLRKLIKNMPHYEYIFDLHSNTRSLIAKFFLSGKKFTYNKNSIARRLFVRFRLGKIFLKKHTVRKYYDVFVLPLKLKHNIDIELLRPFIPNHTLTKSVREEPLVTINPFASKNTKIWPYFSDIVRLLADSGLKIRIIGEGKLENLPANIENFTGKIPYQKLLQYIYDSDIFLTTDSGPMHIAIGLNIPTVAVFGSTTKELGFYPQFKNCKVLEHLNLPCRPCSLHGLDKCPNIDFQCMFSTTVEEVRYNLMALLSSNR